MIHRVFLSSKLSDLQDYRQTVQGAIRQLGAIDVSMEHFGARDERPADECMRLVRDESDLFVGIYAHKTDTSLMAQTSRLQRWNIKRHPSF